MGKISKRFGRGIQGNATALTPRQHPENHARLESQIPRVGYPSHFSDQLLTELIEAGSEAIKIAAEPSALVGHPFAVLNQTKINCEVKKPRSKLVDLAS
jgi:hypothetical protein